MTTYYIKTTYSTVSVRFVCTFSALGCSIVNLCLLPMSTCLSLTSRFSKV
ncbi:hypothetical protein HETIRDRAFT_421989 [Heterobasidion irregulare TC 32-1]|uniref:Uncharacterized protein n=1 Tax=Heterobasidion irregulare (strain TC 32-1) TaxID=747525 RepID=W4JUJ1_HETIT|nr:uncharacterized protein HETIRDRAFT_421989 [Heterobasidion irregulare TC 32-1]ETW76551.1 hypothetical protein HETIRDRAFT_421989 [Heterobasidion irregulare TC 32-1]